MVKVRIDQYIEDPFAKKKRIEQAKELRRVRRNLSDLVLQFCSERESTSFVGEDLENYVRSFGIRIAPGSALRILRLLKKAGRVDYEVVNRSTSRYYIKYVR